MPSNPPGKSFPDWLNSPEARLPDVQTPAERAAFSRKLAETTMPGMLYAPPSAEELAALNEAVEIARRQQIPPKTMMSGVVPGVSEGPPGRGAVAAFVDSLQAESKRLRALDAWSANLEVSRTGAGEFATTVRALVPVAAEATASGSFAPSESWWTRYWARWYPSSPDPWSWHRHYLASLHAFDLAGKAMVSERRSFEPRCLVEYRMPHIDIWGVRTWRQHKEELPCSGEHWRPAGEVERLLAPDRAAVFQACITRAEEVARAASDLRGAADLELRESREPYTRAVDIGRTLLSSERAALGSQQTELTSTIARLTAEKSQCLGRVSTQTTELADLRKSLAALESKSAELEVARTETRALLRETLDGLALSRPALPPDGPGAGGQELSPRAAAEAAAARFAAHQKEAADAERQRVEIGARAKIIREKLGLLGEQRYEMRSKAWVIRTKVFEANGVLVGAKMQLIDTTVALDDAQNQLLRVQQELEGNERDRVRIADLFPLGADGE